MTPTYSCEGAPAEYKVLYKNRTFPKPADKIYRYFIVNESTDKIDTIAAVKSAINVWQKGFDKLGIGFTIEKTMNQAEAHIIISFGKKEHLNHSVDSQRHCPFHFDGANGVLAHAWPLNATKPFAGQLHIDEHEDWTKTNLQTVLIHELGHVFNLDHSDIKNSIMYASYTGPKTELTEDDLNGLAEVFKPLGAPVKKPKFGFFQRVYNFFKF